MVSLQQRWDAWLESLGGPCTIAWDQVPFTDAEIEEMTGQCRKCNDYLASYHTPEWCAERAADLAKLREQMRENGHR